MYRLPNVCKQMFCKPITTIHQHNELHRREIVGEIVQYLLLGGIYIRKHFIFRKKQFKCISVNLNCVRSHVVCYSSFFCFEKSFFNSKLVPKYTRRTSGSSASSCAVPALKIVPSNKIYALSVIESVSSTLWSVIRIPIFLFFSSRTIL